MAGHTVDEAKAAYWASSHRQQKSGNQSAHVASAPTSSSLMPRAVSHGTIFVNGLPYIPDTSLNKATQNTVPSSAHIMEIVSSLDANDYQYHASAFLAFPDVPPYPNFFSQTSSSSFSSAFSISSVPVSSTLPFIIDSGATCHISPFLSDFKHVRNISTHPIKGLGDVSVHALAMGTIELQTSSGRLTLNNAFYVPNSTVRLLSVFLLGDADYTVHFYPRKGLCFISDSHNNVIAKGTALPNRKLFLLSDFSVVVPHLPSTPSFAHYASRLPGIDTWHRRLGHCGHRTIIDMARSNVVQGMPINTSSLPPKCEHCILGKQTRSSVPKVREGPRAVAPLGWVYVDLCGPMSIPSRTGRLYSMNIIDDYFSFVWSIPLRFKDEAAPTLKVWLFVLEVQTPHHLKSFVTDNGELASLQIHQWCTEKGILHLLTAPYTSAQNGRAERLHRTLMDKARAMCSACNSPLNMWDEFCTTAAYLTNFTGTSANNGKTPYELWYNRKPSLSHLREIGCRAFALIPTNNPKIHHRSQPCILIGYAPHSKAYHLWDPKSDRIFNSFHVSFIELYKSFSPSPPTIASDSSTPPHPASSRPFALPNNANNISNSLHIVPPHSAPRFILPNTIIPQTRNTVIPQERLSDTL